MMQEQIFSEETLINLINRGEEILMRTRKVRRDIELRVRRILEEQADESVRALREKTNPRCSDQL